MMTKNFAFHTENTWNSDPGFFKALGSTGDIPLAADGGDDTEFERVEQDTVTLYRSVNSCLATTPEFILFKR